MYLIEPGRWQNAIHFAGFAFWARFFTALSKNRKLSRFGFPLALAYGLLVAASALWVAWAEDGIYERTLSVTSGQAWQLTPVDWAAGIILIIAAIDLSRRVAGWVIPILVILALCYILFLGSYLPGIFRAASLPPDDVLFRTMYNDEGCLVFWPVFPQPILPCL